MSWNFSEIPDPQVVYTILVSVHFRNLEVSGGPPNGSTGLALLKHIKEVNYKNLHFYTKVKQINTAFEHYNGALRK